MMEKEKYRKEKKQLMIQRILHYVSNMVEAVLWHGHLWLPTEQADWKLHYKKKKRSWSCSETKVWQSISS